MEQDNKKRCSWIENSTDEVYLAYHDTQWGVPCYDEHTLIEMLILESFHAGLSWLIVLKKRENFRKAFDNYDLEKIANYDENKIEELKNNKGIIRNRLKIAATIVNVAKILEIKKEFGSFKDYIWSFTDGKIIYNTDDVFIDRTELSDKVSNDMKKRGMKFLGTVTVYAYLQAVGIVQDHEISCFCYKKVGES